MPKLVLRGRDGLAVAFDVASGARIGRDEACEVTLADGKASRHHATLHRDDDGWHVVDNGSRHGTHVNGERVERAALASGDQIQVGATVLELVLDAGPLELVSTPVTRLKSDSERLRVFYQLAAAARLIEDERELLETTLRGVIDAVGAERGLIALSPRPGAPPRRVAEHDGESILVSRSLIEAVIERGESALMREHSARPVANTLQAQGVRAALAAPLVAGDSRGFIYVDCISDPHALGESDLELLTAIATVVASIVSAARRYERAAAIAEVASAEKAPSIIGESPAILDVRRDIERLAAADIAIHITGESGVGKELVARAIHAQSARREHPLVALNCAALPEELIEAELFGHARGAFTGASARRRGRFVLADRGTLFLDEVAELSAAAQAKILRVLEDGELYPVGGEEPQRVDVRIVSASHKTLRAEVEAGRFREDLYYRLVVAELGVPPLRDRGRDVRLLADAFLAAARERGSRGQHFSEDALVALEGHAWPGNVRELRNVVERAAALASNDAIAVEDLRLEARAGRRLAGTLAEQFAALDDLERGLVERALAEADGNVSAAARLLGISRVVIARRIEKYGLGDSAD